jgi:hypothetical protein
MDLLPGDILFTRSKSRLGALIRFCTRRPYEAKTVASHVGIITVGGPLWDAILVEAQSKTNRHSMQLAYANKPDELCIFRPLNLTQDETDDIVAKANSYVGRDYGYFKLVLHLFDWSLGGIYLFRRIGRMDNYPICSYVVAAAYKAAGKDFGVSSYAASPDDIWDYCLKKSNKYQFIWQRGTMYA